MTQGLLPFFLLQAKRVRGTIFLFSEQDSHPIRGVKHGVIKQFALCYPRKDCRSYACRDTLSSRTSTGSSRVYLRDELKTIQSTYMYVLSNALDQSYTASLYLIVYLFNNTQTSIEAYVRVHQCASVFLIYITHVSMRYYIHLPVHQLGLVLKILVPN